MSGQAGTEGIGDEHRPRVVADGAGLTTDLTDVASGPQQLGVGVADVEAGQAATVELVDRAATHEAVVDLAGGRRWSVAPDRLGPKAHTQRLGPPGRLCRPVGAGGALTEQAAWGILLSIYRLDISTVTPNQVTPNQERGTDRG